MKLKSFCIGKDAIIQAKQQPEDWVKMVTNYTSDKWLVSRLYKEVEKKLNIKKTNNPIKKWGTELSREYS